MSVGQISPPINTELGVHILQLVERDDQTVNFRQILLRVDISEQNQDRGAAARGRRSCRRRVLVRSLPRWPRSIRTIRVPASGAESCWAPSRWTSSRPSSRPHCSGMEPGEVTDPIEGAAGFFVLKLVDRAEGEAVTFEELEDRMRQAVFDQKLEAGARRSSSASSASASTSRSRPDPVSGPLIALPEGCIPSLQPQATMADRIPNPAPATSSRLRPRMSRSVISLFHASSALRSLRCARRRLVQGRQRRVRIPRRAVGRGQEQHPEARPDGRAAHRGRGPGRALPRQPRFAVARSRSCAAKSAVSSRTSACSSTARSRRTSPSRRW